MNIPIQADSILLEMAKRDPERLRDILIVSQVEVREVTQEEFDRIKTEVKRV
jgi:hypothetical protein